MKMRLMVGLVLLNISASGQEKPDPEKIREDSLDNARLAQMVSLSEVVVRNDLNVAWFM